jgi:hypothetical protein
MWPKNVLLQPVYHHEDKYEYSKPEEQMKGSKTQMEQPKG